jgi:hypothetical protein
MIWASPKMLVEGHEQEITERHPMRFSENVIVVDPPMSIKLDLAASEMFKQLGCEGVVPHWCFCLAQE